MVRISLTKQIFILAVCVLALLYAAPNVSGAAWMQSVMPSWAPGKTVNLGLDLQGGSHLLLDVDVQSVLRERSDSLVQGARSALREEKIGYRKLALLPGGVRVVLREDGDAGDVERILKDLDTAGLEITQAQGAVEARYTEAAISEIKAQVLEQTIEIVRRRVDETGTKEPVIQRQGDSRVLVQLPGLDDPSRIKDLLGKTAKLTFHLIAQSGGRMVPFMDSPADSLPIQRRPAMSGEMLANAYATFDQNGQPVVGFKMDGIGARKLCDLSTNHVGEPMVVVLDNEIITAPNLREPICGGSGQISGSFTLAEANDLAILLRAGALPAPLKIVEERTVGPTLGADSVEAGKLASALALGLVLIFMIAYYRLFGVFADVALLVNMALIFAVLSTLQATLTLPGIAGIVLTIGMAVDANVLIFERIREELRAGRTPIAAVDIGYKSALSTILDSNITTLIAALMLYSFGTGPIKGFAVTLAIGIGASLFSAIMVTRALIVLYLNKFKPSTLAV